MHSITLDYNESLVTARGAKPAVRTGKSTTVLPAHLAISGLLVGMGLLEQAIEADMQNLLYPACLVFALVLVWILGSWYSVRKTLFEPYPLFMIAAGLFNGGQALLELGGLNRSGILGGRFSPEALVPALYLVTLSLAATHAGALLAVAGKHGTPGALRDTRREHATRLVGWLLLAISIVPTFLLLQNSISIVLDFGYLWLYRRDQSIALIWALSGLLVPGILFLLSGAKNKRAVQAFCLAAGGVYAGINLFLGARAAVVMSGVAIAWVYDRVGKRIPRMLIVALGIVSLVVFSWVRETRAIGGRWRMSVSSQMETITNLQNPMSSSVAEMGYSLVAVADTLALVPGIRPFDDGVSYLYAASTIIPNLGWEVHPGKAHGLLCDWLTQTVEPTVAAAGGGLGYSFIAEAYLNFGWIGGPLWLMILGYLLSRLFRSADSGDPAKAALVASFLSSLFIFTRGESALVVRGLVWYAIIPYLLVTAIAARRRRRAQQI